MRIVFAGTPSAAAPSLAAVSAGNEVALVVTRPDAPLGRRRVLTPSPVCARAAGLGLPTRKTSRFDAETAAAIAAEKPDLGVVVAFGAIIPDPVLETPRLGWINLHFSLLPRWRGAAPVQRSIEHGDRTGVSIVRVVTELDAGPVLASRAVEVGEDATASDALEILAAEGARDLVDVVAALGDGSASAAPQRGEASYAGKVTRADGRIDWARPVGEVYRRIRAMTTEPGAWSLDGDNQIKLLLTGPARAIEALGDDKEGLPGRVVVEGERVFVQCRDGFLPISRVQPAGKQAMTASAWMAGKRGARVVLA